MIKIYPFRGIRYNTDKVVDLSAVVTQPYDKIKDDLMENYYQRHPNNYTRIIKAREEPHTSKDNRYIRARNYIHDWMNDGILVRDNNPAIYPYYQEYMIDGVTRVRKGVTVLVNLRDTEVKAHEKTLEGPKADRLNLMWATAAHTGHIFILYPDPENRVNAILDKTAGAMDPIAVAKDDFDCHHRMWSITDGSDIAEIQNILQPHDLFIADGHHRTETARNYMNAMDLIGLKGEGSELPENCLMTLISMDDPGLVVLPTHRYVHSVPNFSREEFLKAAAENFTVETESGCTDASHAEQVLKMKLDTARNRGEKGFGVYFEGCYVAFLTLKDSGAMKKLLPGDMSDEWRNLDVSILHTAILENLLGIDSEKLAMQTNVKYPRNAAEAFDELESDPKGNAVFMINPTLVSEVKDIAMAGERMPQKSTDFFPKLLSGMIFNKIRHIGFGSEYFSL